jgi:hypothetical protein
VNGSYFPKDSSAATFGPEAGGRLSSGKTKEYRERAVQPQRILVVEFSDALANRVKRSSIRCDR